MFRLRDSSHITEVDGSDMPSPEPNAALTSRFNQMFPVLSAGEIDRVRRFGEVRRFPDGHRRC